MACAAMARPCASQAVDWSGQWISRGGQDVEVLRNVHLTPKGWNGLVGDLARSREYSIRIAQAAGEIVVTFPGGSSNMLTMPAFVPGAGPRATSRRVP
jgi:hypothetical protein